MNVKLTLGLGILFGAIAWGAESQSFSVTIGGQKIFVELAGEEWAVQDPRTDPWLINPPPEGSQVVAIFHSGDRSRYAMIQSIPGFDGPEMPASVLTQMLSTFAGNMRRHSKLDEETWVNLKKAYEHSPRFSGTKDPEKEVQDFSVAEVLGESKVHSSVMGFLTIYTEQSGKRTRALVLMSTTLMIVKDRIFYFNFYEPFVGQNSCDNVRSTTLSSIARTLAKNS